MTPYLITLLIGAVLSVLLYGIRVHQLKKKPALAAFGISVPLMVLFGLLCAKVVYALCFLDLSYVDEYWFEDTFLGTSANEFSVFGGAIGILLAIGLAARLTKTQALPLLDAFAPCGALFLVFVRMSEIHQGRLGAGALVSEASVLARFPLAIQNEYGEWFVSIFLLEALVALIVALVFFFVPISRPGLRLELTAIYLAVPQIFCESLRAKCMKWGFVRIEQLFCGIFILLMVAWNGLKTNRSNRKRFLPALGILGAIGVIVFVEFALDKFNIPHLVSYGMMICALIAMAILEHKSIRNRYET